MGSSRLCLADPGGSGWVDRVEQRLGLLLVELSCGWLIPLRDSSQSSHQYEPCIYMTSLDLILTALSTAKRMDCGCATSNTVNRKHLIDCGGLYVAKDHNRHRVFQIAA